VAMRLLPTIGADVLTANPACRIAVLIS
jgi:hypothetical protein